MKSVISRQHLPAGAQVSRPRHGKVERRAGAGGIADVIEQQSHFRHCIGAQCFAHDHRRATLGAMSTRVNPIRLFVTHYWEENDDYTRVFEYLEAPGTFYYVNTSQPHGEAADRQGKPARGSAPANRALRSDHRIADGLSGEPELGAVPNEFREGGRPARSSRWRISDRTEPLAKAIKDLADEVSAWNERSLIDALRRQARHQETTRWDTHRIQARLTLRVAPRAAFAGQLAAMSAGISNSVALEAHSTLRS